MSPETRQQIIALVLGLVFILGFVLFAQRLGQFLRDRQQKTQTTATTLLSSPTRTPVTPTPSVVVSRNDKKVLPLRREPTAIPSTGPETSLLFILTGAFGGGYWLRRFSKKI